MRQEIRAIIAAQAKLARPMDSVGDDTDLFEAGMDSLAVVNVMLALEEHFGVEIPDAMLNRQSFSSIAALERAIQSIKGGPAAVGAAA